MPHWSDRDGVTPGIHTVNSSQYNVTANPGLAVDNIIYDSDGNIIWPSQEISLDEFNFGNTSSRIIEALISSEQRFTTASNVVEIAYENDGYQGGKFLLKVIVDDSGVPLMAILMENTSKQRDNYNPVEDFERILSKSLKKRTDEEKEKLYFYMSELAKSQQVLTSYGQFTIGRVTYQLQQDTEGIFSIEILRDEYIDALQNIKSFMHNPAPKTVTELDILTIEALCSKHRGLERINTILHGNMLEIGGVNYRHFQCESGKNYAFLLVGHNSIGKWIELPEESNPAELLHQVRQQLVHAFLNGEEKIWEQFYTSLENVDGPPQIEEYLPSGIDPDISIKLEFRKLPTGDIVSENRLYPRNRYLKLVINNVGNLDFSALQRVITVLNEFKCITASVELSSNNSELFNVVYNQVSEQWEFTNKYGDRKTLQELQLEAEPQDEQQFLGLGQVMKKRKLLITHSSTYQPQLL